MSQPKGLARVPGSGRQKGTPNKLTKSVKEMIVSIFNELQDVDAKGAPRHPGACMLNWAKREPGAFYLLASKLLPSEIKAEVSGARPFTIQIVKFGDLPDSDAEE